MLTLHHLQKGEPAGPFMHDEQGLPVPTKHHQVCFPMSRIMAARCGITSLVNADAVPDLVEGRYTPAPDAATAEFATGQEPVQPVLLR